LIAATYDAIRTSPYWWTSVLIITYDEHGGYYDHVAPPAATPPGDTPTAGLNTNGFDFSRYGVRVPAVVISPLTVKGVISKQLYDHTSVLATLQDIWNMDSLTERDAGANNFTNLFVSLSSPRTNTPIALTPNTISGSSITGDVAAESLIAAPAAAETDESAAPTAPRKTIPDSQPLPERGNIIGFLHVALKAEIELSDGSDATKQALIDNFKATVHTYGDANAYFEKVASAVDAARAAKQA
jgi:phospholipase C